MNERLIKNIITEELFGYRICESVEQTFLVDYIYSDTIFPEYILEKLLIGEPVTVPELRDILHKKIVNFEFIKLDGNIRPARGTTVMKYIPKKDHPSGTNPASDKVAAFFDLNKNAWRSVSNRSKEIVLAKDEKTGKPKVVVSDKKPKEEPVKQETKFEPGKLYQFTTRKGLDTEVKVLKELPDGMIHVKSPKFKNTFAIDPTRIGQEIVKPEEKPKPRPIPPPMKPIVRPSIKPKSPIPIPPEEIPAPPVEEEPLDLRDPTKMADDIQDKDIIAPGIKHLAKPDDKLEIKPKSVPEQDPLPPTEEITFKEEPDDEDEIDSPEPSVTEK